MDKNNFPFGKCKRCSEPLWEGGCCPNCEAYESARQEREARLIQMMGSERAAKLYTVARYKVTPANTKVFETCKDFEPSRDNIFLHGPSGRGKSHLAAIAKRSAIGKKVLVVTRTMDDILLDMRKAIHSAHIQKEIVEFYIRTPVLNIEDLGAEKVTEFGMNVLYQIVDGRYKAVRNGLIITSNLSLDWIAADHTNERVSSRLMEMCRNKVFDMTDEMDWRKGAS